MKIYKHDRRFAIKEIPYGWVDVFVKDEFTGEYKVEYKAVNLEASFQKIYQLTGEKKFVDYEDFEENEK